jgi:hypothetical protein
MAHGIREQFLKHEVEAQALVAAKAGVGAEALEEFTQRAQPVEAGDKHGGS